MTEPDYKQRYARPKPEAEVRKVSPKEAKFILSYCNEGNRKEKTHSINAMARNILNNQFPLVPDFIGFDTDGSLVNGQNRLMAILKAGEPCEIGIVYGLHPKSRSFTDQGEARTVRDIQQIERVEAPPKALEVARMIFLVVEPSRKTSKAERNHLIIDYYSYYKEGIDFVLATCGKQMQVPVLAAAVAAYYNGHSEFLRIFGPHLNRKEPGLEIRRAAQTTLAETFNTDLRNFQVLIVKEKQMFLGSPGRLLLYQFAIKAIDAFRRKHRVSLSLKNTERNLPFVMPRIDAGTRQSQSQQKKAG
jgi:hypothetical protein